MTIPALPNAELAVMDLLWTKGRITARQIIDRLYADAPKPQHGTVQRLLQRLAAKGFLDRDRSLGISVYSPAISRDAYA
ncbi:MAG: BlaI/MecI/CopY family transcriptional regulator, partial [Gemmatimonadetes bacterium]|nr:BlaI/MecI/CopY family transcriptional regulator [Gemmatimonadota bacterium]